MTANSSNIVGDLPAVVVADDAALIAAARQRANSDQCVMVTLVNAPFRDLCDNWLASVERVAPAQLAHTLIVALDDIATRHYAERSDVAVVQWSGACGHSAAVAFGTAAFNALCHVKLALVDTLLSADLNVLWCDTDIVWLGDALQHVCTLARRPAVDEQLAGDEKLSRRLFLSSRRKWRTTSTETDNSFDIAFQADDDGICAGFYYARATSNTRKYIQKAVQYLNPVVCDQMAMRRFLGEHWAAWVSPSPPQ